MKAVWTMLAMLFGLLALGALASAVQAARYANTYGSSFAVESGAADAALRILVIVAAALAARGCYRRAAREGQARTPDAEADRRPWDR